MASIVFQKYKRSGITYAYESASYWDKEKRQSRAKRTLIGRLDERTGEIVILVDADDAGGEAKEAELAQSLGAPVRIAVEGRVVPQ